MTAYKFSDTDRSNARVALKARLRRGKTLYTTVRSVSRSGMSRRMRVYAVAKGELVDVTRDVAALNGYSFDRDKWDFRIDGCGMDMGFEAVYQTSHALYKDGYAIKQRWA